MRLSAGVMNSDTKTDASEQASTMRRAAAWKDRTSVA
jgi:hypothetical protein